MITPFSELFHPFSFLLSYPATSPYGFSVVTHSLLNCKCCTILSSHSSLLRPLGLLLDLRRLHPDFGIFFSACVLCSSSHMHLCWLAKEWAHFLHPPTQLLHALLTTFSPLLFVSDICLSSASFQAPSLTTSLILLIGFWPSIFSYSHKFSIEAPWSFSKLKIKTLLYLKTFSGYHHVQEKLATPCEGKDSPLRPRFLHSSCISIYYYMWSNQ